MIRASTPVDLAALEALYAAAFPDEDLGPLMRELISVGDTVTSLVLEIDGNVAGHIVLTICGLDPANARIALLGPLAVAPAHQRQGYGTALIEAGTRQMAERGVAQIQVLGDPNYYGRTGFVRDNDVAAPYPLPTEWAEAWRKRVLIEQSTPLAGKLIVPQVWQNPALWGK